MNSFFGLGPMELVIIVFLALIVLGPQRLPGTIREVMKYWRYFRNLSGELTSQLGEEFRDLEDLNPQKILKSLADELEDEAEQTTAVASGKKPAAKKTTAKKTTAVKTTTAAKTSNAAKTTTTAKKPATSGVVKASPPAATAPAAAAAADDPGDDKPATGDADQAEAPAAPDAQTPSQNGDMAASVTPEQPLAAEENSILPPANADDAGTNAPVTSVAQDGDGQQVEETAFEQGSRTGAPVSSDAGEADGPDEDSPAPTTKQSRGPAEPAPVSVNGKGARPEDEG